MVSANQLLFAGYRRFELAPKESRSRSDTGLDLGMQTQLEFVDDPAKRGGLDGVGHRESGA
jgi:hypothetical protein